MFFKLDPSGGVAATGDTIAFGKPLHTAGSILCHGPSGIAAGNTPDDAARIKPVFFRRVAKVAAVGRQAVWLASDHANDAAGTSLIAGNNMTVCRGFAAGT